MYRLRLLAMTAALFILMIVAPRPLSAQELSPATRTEPATDAPPVPTWLTDPSTSAANLSNSPQAAPVSTPQIPPGWMPIADESLGYSLAVPADWLTFDLQSGDLDRIAGMLGGRAASQQLRQYMASPSGQNLGLLAVDPDPSELFARPPFPTFLNVSVAQFPDGVTDEQWVALVEDAVSALGEARIENVRLGTLNQMPAVRAAAVYQLGGRGAGLTAHLDITIVHADQAAYTLLIATRLSNALAKRIVIHQIVQSFRPVLPEQGTPAQPAQTPAGEQGQPGSSASVPVANLPRFWIPIVDGRLGYSLAVPFNWLAFDLQEGELDQVTGLLDGETATQQLRAFLDTPEGERLGVFAVEPDPESMYTVPIFPTFLIVSTAPLPKDLSDEDWPALAENAVAAWGDIQSIAVETGTSNGLPFIRAVAAIRLGDPSHLLAAHLDITILRADQTAYLLTIAARPDAAAANQPVIDQIVDSFRVE
ncbi:MAG: hypothetical protein F4X62_14145 [Caldilineaceae bacterium SB0662_bin_25]|nr:hypothetical protein [Caldilineaceae bacterium SB0662_bin_25]